MNTLTEAYRRLTAKLFCNENNENSGSNVEVEVLKKSKDGRVKYSDDIRITNTKSGEVWTISREIIPAQTEEECGSDHSYKITLKNGSGATLDAFESSSSFHYDKFPGIRIPHNNPYAKIYEMANAEIKKQHDNYKNSEHKKEQKNHAVKLAVAQSKINSFFNGGKE